MNKFDNFAFNEEPHILNLAYSGNRTFHDTCNFNSDCQSGLSCCWGTNYAYNPDFGSYRIGYQQMCDYNTCSASKNTSAGVFFAYFFTFVFLIVMVSICARRRRMQNRMLVQQVSQTQVQSVNYQQVP